MNFDRSRVSNKASGSEEGKGGGEWIERERKWIQQEYQEQEEQEEGKVLLSGVTLGSIPGPVPRPGNGQVHTLITVPRLPASLPRQDITQLTLFMQSNLLL